MFKKISLIGLLICGLSAPAFADGKQYSADMEMRSAEGNITGRIYASGQKLRYDMGPMITITRLDEQKSYMLMPDQKMYMSHPIDPTAAAKAGIAPEGSVSVESLGPEEFEGLTLQKTKVVYSGEKNAGTVYQWVDQDQFPVKVEAEDSSWSVVYRNIDKSAPADEVFEIPSDYQLMDLSAMGSMLNATVSETP